jgi:hypothetical protein
MPGFSPWSLALHGSWVRWYTYVNFFKKVSKLGESFFFYFQTSIAAGTFWLLVRALLLVWFVFEIRT